jgi:hypothetical protein
MTVPVSLAAFRAQRDWRAMQKDVRKEFAFVLGAAMEVWRTHHPYHDAHYTQPVVTALTLTQRGNPLSERQLKDLRDTLLHWHRKEIQPSVADALNLCLEALTQNGKHLLGYGNVQSIPR